MKGIVLAGGTGTRLHPLTLAASKQLLPVYDKPMIYYPLSLLMLAGLREIAIITTPQDRSGFERLLGDGRFLGLSLTYLEQPSPDGIAQALLLAEDFLDGDACCLVLGDNILYGHGLPQVLRSSVAQTDFATVFAYHVDDPERYGVVTFDEDGVPLSLVEKPQEPLSPWAVIGLYVYPSDAPSLTRRLRPSARGELEITDLNRLYLEQKRLSVTKLGRGYAWLDAGTPDSLVEASEFVRVLEKRAAQKIACLEEIAYLQGWLSSEALREAALRQEKSPYGRYLLKLASSG